MMLSISLGPPRWQFVAVLAFTFTVAICAWL